ncbi:hypothetical protein OG884_18985 [Streptosporangium sp. NBC_01755]|uniref:hypothetical protein n=1 Tax=Streptosporangium sp. NBC_01755 TaxID=2975949 RepID=UPI002DDB60CA|nr:hypothetical protein [Streptosporangium sp. NBC_01755]WSD03895.1 hypothetical protein OG884_18985 [Streptosporangium sp. NBC_01755]
MPRRLLRSRAERAADKAAAEQLAARASIEAQRARDQRELEHLEAEQEKLKVRSQLTAEQGRLAEQETEKRKTRRRHFRSRVSLAVVLASANIGVNAAAVLGQILALMYGLSWEWWQAVPLAVVVESVAVNVGYLAHDKMIKGFSAYGLRLLSYVIGIGVGLFNYSHNSGLTETQDFAGVFGAASVLSPVLWQIYSQWRHWESMREQGLLEQRPLRFPLLRWVIPSLRAETWEAFKYGVAEGVQSPEVALAVVRSRNTAGNAQEAIREAERALIAVQADALKLTLTHLAAVYHDLDGEDPKGTEARQNIARFMARFTPFVPPLDPGQWSPEPATEGHETGTEAGTAKETKKPSEQDNDHARDFVRESIRRRKVVPTALAVGDEFGFSKSWGYDRVVEVREELSAKGWVFPNSGPPVSPAASKRIPARSLEESPSEEPAVLNGATVGSGAVGGAA